MDAENSHQKKIVYVAAQPSVQWAQLNKGATRPTAQVRTFGPLRQPTQSVAGGTEGQQ